MINDEGTTVEVASTGSGEHAAQQDQTQRSFATTATTSAAVSPQQVHNVAPAINTTAAPPAAATAPPRQEVELTDAGTRLKLQGKLDEGTPRRNEFIIIKSIFSFNK
jgi:hypothetical protein